MYSDKELQQKKPMNLLSLNTIGTFLYNPANKTKNNQLKDR